MTTQTSTPKVLAVIGSWNAPSELFIKRHLEMLYSMRCLEGIAAAMLADDQEWNNIPVWGLNEEYRASSEQGKPNPFVQRAKLSKILDSTEVDVIYFEYGTIAELFYEIAMLASQKILIHVHGKDTHTHMNSTDYVEKLRRLSERAIIICNSRETFNRLILWGIDENRLIVKHYGVHVPSEPYGRESGPHEPITILHLGRLIDCKSPDRTIAAFEMACEKGLNGNLIIAGDGPLKTTCDFLRKRSPWSKKIHLLGAVSEQEGIVLRRDADVFTQHSIKGELTGQVEAFGVSIVEAMADALPVVSCSIGGIKETVVHGETGILVEPGNVIAQAQALLYLADKPELRTKMGYHGWERAQKHFSYQQEASRLREIIRAL